MLCYCTCRTSPSFNERTWKAPNARFRNSHQDPIRPAQRRAFLVLPRCPLPIYLTSDFFRWPIIRGHMRTRLDHVGVGQTPSSPSLPPLFSANATLVRASGRVSDVTLLCARMSAEVHVSQRRRILTPSASPLTSTTSSSSTSQSVVVSTGI